MCNLINSPITSVEAASFIDYILNEWPEKVNEQFKPYLCRKNEFTVEIFCSFWRNSAVVLFQMNKNLLTKLHENFSSFLCMVTRYGQRNWKSNENMKSMRKWGIIMGKNSHWLWWFVFGKDAYDCFWLFFEMNWRYSNKEYKIISYNCPFERSFMTYHTLL